MRGIIKELKQSSMGDIEDRIYTEILRLRSYGQLAAFATVIRTKGSTPGKPLFKMLIYSNGKMLGTIGGGSTEAKIISEALNVIKNQKTKISNFELNGHVEKNLKESPICGGKVEVLIEPIIIKPTIYIMGAGHVGQALAKIGKTTGFRIVILDDREEFANHNWIPEADEIHLVDFGKIEDKIKINQYSYVVIVTKGHIHDKVVLKTIIKSQAKYIGMIGSNKKVKEIFQRLTDEGIDKELLNQVYAPIGLNIGAQTPSEIAISVLAEIVAKHRGKDTHICSSLSYSMISEHK
jgi:xanthine dehydrogenase accessory factor